MNDDLLSSTREEQFLEVLERALKKIVKNVSSAMISSVYSEADSNDLLFIEIASNKLINEFKDSLRSVILLKCLESGILDYLHNLDSKDMQMAERVELAEKFCGNVIDVNKVLEHQRLQFKKQLVRSLEKEIRSMESQLRIMFNENKADVDRITQGIRYLGSVPHFPVCNKQIQYS